MQRQKNDLKLPDTMEMVDKISIREKIYPANSDSSDIIVIYICANAERNLWCFRLENEYDSGWDGWPVYMGGFITPDQFLNYTNKLNFHHYDNLLKSKNQVNLIK